MYSSNESMLRRRFNVDQNNCSFCDTEIEITDHLFFHCMYSMTFWEDLQDWLSTKNDFLDFLTRENIVFVINMKDIKSDFIEQPDTPGKMFHPRIRMEENETPFLCL